MIHFDKDSNFEELISNGIVLVDFYADWCGPCKMLSPVVEELSTENKDIKFIKLNVDLFNEISSKYGIMNIPSLIIFKDGKAVNTHTGFLPKELLQKWIEENRV